MMLLIKDCGLEVVRQGARSPNVFTKNPGWVGWNGPYVRGDVRVTDYHGTAVRFAFSNAVFRQVSAGLDRTFETVDDIKLEIKVSDKDGVEAQRAP